MSNKKYDVEQILTAPICRAARGLLDWSQGDLADRARVGRSTVADFERGSRQPVRNNIVAMAEALLSAGVEFTPENGGGAGVRFKKPKR